MEVLLWGGMQGGEGEVYTRDMPPAPGHAGIPSLTFTFQATSRWALAGDMSLNYSDRAEKSHPCVSDSLTLIKKMLFSRANRHALRALGCLYGSVSARKNGHFLIAKRKHIQTVESPTPEAERAGRHTREGPLLAGGDPQ